MFRFCQFARKQQSNLRIFPLNMYPPIKDTIYVSSTYFCIRGVGFRRKAAIHARLLFFFCPFEVRMNHRMVCQYQDTQTYECRNECKHDRSIRKNIRQNDCKNRRSLDIKHNIRFLQQIQTHPKQYIKKRYKNKYMKLFNSV